jgi:tetratricopeptide (TPR) repeat protein
MMASVDPRFAAIVAANPAHFDLRAAQEQQLERARGFMRSNPDSLEVVVQALRDLRALGRFDEALALDQAALDRIAQAPKDHPAFKDLSRELTWAYDMKAHILIELGRTDEGLEVERQAAALPENGVANVSEALNYIALLLDNGHPDEALRRLQAFDATALATPYGLGWLHGARACADQELGLAADLQKERAYLAAHPKDNPGASVEANVCVDDLDAAAATIIAQLETPETRIHALIDLCEFDPPSYSSPLDLTIRPREQALEQRADVRAAIAKAGRVERIHLSREIFVDLP